MFRYCFLFLQELDQKKSIFKVVNIILSIIHFLHDQIQACFTHDSPPLYCMACSLYLTFSHAQNGGRPPFSLLTSPSPCLSPPPPISLSPAPPPPLLYFMTGPLQKMTSTLLHTWWGWPDFSHFRLLWLQQSRKSKLASPSAWRLSINLKFNYRAIFEQTLRRKEQSFLLEHELLLTLAKPKFSIPVC